MALNTNNLNTNRGVIKIFQIAFGFASCFFLCHSFTREIDWCFHGNRDVNGFLFTLCFVTMIINVVLFVLNLLGLIVYRLECVYSVLGAILFVVAFGLLIWVLVKNEKMPQNVAAIVSIGILMLLFIWDYQILHGQAFN